MSSLILLKLYVCNTTHEVHSKHIKTSGILLSSTSTQEVWYQALQYYYTQSIFSTPILSRIYFTHTTETLVIFSIILHWTFFFWFVFWTLIFVCFSVDLDTFCLRTGSHTSSCCTISLGRPNLIMKHQELSPKQILQAWLEQPGLWLLRLVT